MTGKQIAENLRANREKWLRSEYHRDGKYCVIGLKLKELGVPVETWGEVTQGDSIGAILSGDLTDDEMHALRILQRRNDSAQNVEALIEYVDTIPDQEFALEKAAEILKARTEKLSQR